MRVKREGTGTRILRALSGVPGACETADRLAELVGLDLDTFATAAVRLHRAGKLEIWPQVDDRGRAVGVAVALPARDPRAAEGGELVLASDLGAGGIPDDAQTTGAAIRAEREAWAFTEDEWNAAEGDDNAVGFRIEPVVPFGCARPELLIGCGIAWCGPAWAAEKPCPACHGARLPEIGYCLACDRFGDWHNLIGTGPVKEGPVRVAGAA